MNKLLLAFITTMLLCGVVQAEPEKKKKVSARQAERYCNLSAQDRYAHLAKFCKQLQAKKVIPAAAAVVASTYTDDSSASFFRQEKERAEASQFFSGWQKLDAPPTPVETKKPKLKPVMAVIDLNTELPKGSTKLSQSYPEQPVRRENPRPIFAPDPVRIAREWEGYNARKNRQDLIKMLSDGNDMKVDPARIPWCAGFVNAILSRAGYEGTGSLMARSFLGYGIPTTYPREGDIAVFSRGKNSSAGHVGFYVGEETVDGVKYIKVLGGNQNKEVSVAYYPANKLLGYRKLG
jgi:uncharacterized protein (TIGR02594 family)